MFCLTSARRSMRLLVNVIQKRTLIRNINDDPTDIVLTLRPPPEPSPLFPDVLPDKFGNSKLHIAAQYSRDEVVLELLQTDSSIVDARNNAGLTALHVAALTTMFNSNLNVMRHLLDFGADVNAVDANGVTPLIIASGTQFVKGVELLLERNADRYWKSKTGSLAMHAAARLGRIEFFHALHRRNEPVSMQADAADVNAIRPLHIAAYYNRAAFANELIQVGANVDALATAHARSPLAIAALRKNIDVMNVLLRANANQDLADAKGQSPRRQIEYLLASQK